MKTYAITVRATVTKTYEIEAESRDEAVETAHEIFSTSSDGVDEDYQQETLDVEEVK